MWLTQSHPVIGACLSSALSDLLLLKGEVLIKERSIIHRSVTCRYTTILDRVAFKRKLRVSLHSNIFMFSSGTDFYPELLKFYYIRH